MFHTKRVDEESAFTESELEGIILQKTLTLHHDLEQVGEVVVFAHKYLPDIAVLQAERYKTPLPLDIFFAKGLVRRGYSSQPVKIPSGDSLQGIVLSKSSGRVLPGGEDHFLGREKDIKNILEVIQYRQQHKEEFCDYVVVGSSGNGFLGHYYQPAGKELREKIFLAKRKEDDMIKKETLKNHKNEKEEDAVYNGELFLRKKSFDDFTITLGRTSFILQREGQGLYLRNQQIDCLRKVLEMYQKNVNLWIP